MIRRATIDDLPAILPLAERFRDHVTMRDVPMERIEDSLSLLLASDAAVIFVYERNGVTYGALVAVESFTWFSPDVRLAIELAWWCQPEYRRGPAAIRLVESLERWASERGCHAVVLHTLQIPGEESVDGMASRLGFALREQTYVKELTNARVL
jgi:GNAT superfamily N-acetyltransferase